MEFIDFKSPVSPRDGVTISVVEETSDRFGDEVRPSLIGIRREEDARRVARIDTDFSAVDAEARVRAAETASTELRRQLRDDAIKLGDDLRERTREAAAAPAAELRTDVGEKFAALRSELGEKIVSLSARPAFNLGQIDRAVEAAAAVTRIEMRAEFDRVLESRLEEKERAFENRTAEFERRAEIAEQRARAPEAAIAELRQQMCNDTIRLADDLRARVRDASAASTIELRADLESKFAARLADAEKRAERAEERARAIEIAMVELRGAVRDDVATASGDLRQQAREAVVAAVAELRTEIEAKIAAVAERPGKLSIAKGYEPGAVVYRGELVVDDGSCWQALRDTARVPGEGDDWACVAKGGRAGADGDSMRLRGGFDLRDCYRALDVVAYEGQGYIATRENPGVPGVDDDWLMIGARGVKGERGEPGAPGARSHKGDRGPAGAKIDEWRINREHFVAVPFYSDGRAGPPLRLRDLFQEFIDQTGYE